jgi:hypothetical protein
MHRLTIARLVVAVAAVALLAVGVVGSADAARKSKTRISIRAQEDGFFGSVKSRRESCADNRKVVLYKRTGRRVNRRRDERIGSDRAQPNGDRFRWSINTDEEGRFYAYSKATRKCASAFSRVVRAEEEDDED